MPPRSGWRRTGSRPCRTGRIAPRSRRRASRRREGPRRPGPAERAKPGAAPWLGSGVDPVRGCVLTRGIDGCVHVAIPKVGEDQDEVPSRHGQSHNRSQSWRDLGAETIAPSESIRLFRPSVKRVRPTDATPLARAGRRRARWVACSMRCERTCLDCEANAHCRSSGPGYTRLIGSDNGEPVGRCRGMSKRGRRMSDTDDLMPEIEATGERLVRAREMIARRIIGQEAVVEQTLIAILSRRARAAGRRAGAGEDPAGRDARHRARADRAPGAVHPGPDAGRHPRRRGAGDRADGSRAFRFIDGPIFCQLLMADEINRA